MPGSEEPWLEGREGLISLTFDDGLDSQLRRAIPCLNELGLRGTFYLNPGEKYREQLLPWRQVVAAGHEVGNHTCAHPCSRAMGKGAAGGLEAMTLDDIERDILQAERRLREMLPEQKDRSFCYPCYNQHVGHGAGRQSYVPVVARHFIAGRGGSANRGFLINPAGCDLHYLEAQQAENMTGYEMVGLCERAAREGMWLILAFHGIQEDILSVTESAFQELCAHLARHRDRFHVAPVIDIARRIADARRG